MTTNMWFFNGIRRLGRTERFPDAEPACAARWSTELAGSGTVSCPAGAITDKHWDAGRCICCRRCFPAWAPTGNVRLSTVDRGLPGQKFAPFKRSLYLYAIDAGTCGACNMELQALSTPHYDMNRFGLFFTNSPRHADALIVMGVHADRMDDVIEKACDAMPDPKMILALGTCAISGGILGKAPRTCTRPLVSIPGCPPNPYTILEGILKAKEVSSE